MHGSGGEPVNAVRVERHGVVEQSPGLTAVGGGVELIAERAGRLCNVDILGAGCHSVGIVRVDHNIAISLLLGSDISERVVSHVQHTDSAGGTVVVPGTLRVCIGNDDLAVAVVLHALYHKSLGSLLNGRPCSAGVGGLIDIVIALARNCRVDSGAAVLIAGVRVDDYTADSVAVAGSSICAEVKCGVGLTAIGGFDHSAAAHESCVNDVAVLGIHCKTLAVASAHAVAVNAEIRKLGTSEGHAIIVGNEQRSPAAAEVAGSCQHVNAVGILFAERQRRDTQESLVLLADAIGHGLPQLGVLIVAVSAAYVSSRVVKPVLAGGEHAGNKSAAAHRDLSELPSVLGNP